MKKIIKIFMLVAAIGFAAPSTYAQVSVGLSVRLAPPPLPVYVQPDCPADGYLWQPGYWAYDNADGYYWVPGVWVAPPNPGLLWTPNYWGYDNGVYLYHAGYWGPHVGFYGGINYGFGYSGVGFGGGLWVGSHFRYNTAVFHVNTTIVHNTYIDRTVIHNDVHSRASFNGPGGINRRPDANEQRFSAERHVAPTHVQMTHQENAGHNPQQRFTANHGKPFTTTQARAENHPVNASGFGHGNNTPAGHNAPANNGGQPNRSGFGHNNGAMGAQQHAAPEQHAASQQQHMEQHAAPQQHMEQHAQPQQQQHAQPQQHQPMGGGGAPRGFGGGGGAPHGGGGGMPHGGGGGGGHGHHP